MDGTTPTTTTAGKGLELSAHACVWYPGTITTGGNFKDASFIAQTATASTLTVQYFTLLVAAISVVVLVSLIKDK